MDKIDRFIKSTNLSLASPVEPEEKLHDILMVKPKNGFWSVGKLNGKSKDSPEAINSRLFVGNLPASGVQLARFTEAFAKYGTVLDASLHNRFGFIQYECADVARQASDEMNGILFEGSRIDVNVASERRKKRNPGDPLEPAKKIPRKQVSDALVIICNRDIRSYSDAVLHRLKELHVVCDSFFWSENMPLPQIINDITKDGVLYAVVLTEACAVDKTLNIHVLQGKNPKDFRDVPLNDAFDLLERDFLKAQAARAQVPGYL